MNNKKVTDHHAIIPTRELQKCNLSELPQGELAILQLISNRLCVAVGDPHRYAETVIELDCGGTAFSAKGKTMDCRPVQSLSLIHILSDVVNRMQGNFGTDRDHYMKSLMRPDLLILDDLGAERNTSFGKERVFDVVDKRLLSGKPMIVTTNIPLSVMKQAVELDDRRIFDRILEVCVPIRFDGENFRKGNARANIKKAAEMLNG